ncbi:MAG TPA: hypothetical protein VLA02_14865 [Reyranella sp.]|nr:hypothetical protein [Reyranella sp.]
MRLLLASVAALAAVVLAAPSYAQSEAAPTPTPIAKPKPGTTAYCNTLKSASSRSACLKRVQAGAKSTPATTTAKKTKAKKLEPPKSDSSAWAAPATAPLPPQTVAIPPLPQKTI